MRLEVPFRSDWGVDLEISNEDLFCILDQPFRYLNKGAQCYAFVSQDEKYVLKLFRFDQRHFFRRKRSKRPFDQKINGFFEGCKLACTAMQETGILYLHLNLTTGTLPVLKATGSLGRPFHLSLDRYRFALQKKATPLADGLFAARGVAKLPERIEEIVSLLESRIGKGIGNTDPSLWRNFGFLEDKAIEFDFGNYVARSDFSDVRSRQAELERYMRPLRSWLETNAPEYLADFNARVERARL